MSVDTVFNEGMRPVFSDEPATVKRRLKHPFPESWKKVCVGDTGLVVTISEYLYEEKYSDVMALVNDLLRKQDQAMYRRHPQRLDVYKHAAVKKIIERVLRD